MYILDFRIFSAAAADSLPVIPRHGPKCLREDISFYGEISGFLLQTGGFRSGLSSVINYSRAESPASELSSVIDLTYYNSAALQHKNLIQL